jgi:hypothetical protein
MPMHEQKGPNAHGHGPEKIDASAGFERTDANVTGIVVFLVALAIFVAVTGLLCYGIGKAFNAYLNKQDGPNTKWTKTADVRDLGNMPSSPELQNKVAALTQSFPTPRLLIDDGDQDVADLHARENLLLENYSWVDQSSGKVRIPIERAMELIAQHGLPVRPAVQTEKPMTGDVAPTVTMPLTDGFAPTGYEQAQQEQAEALKKQEEAAK